MSVQLSYRVKTGFKYRGRFYKEGETWEPQGGRWDDVLIENEQYVKPVKTPIKKTRADSEDSK